MITFKRIAFILCSAALIHLLAIQFFGPYVSITGAARVQMNYFSELKVLSDVLKVVQAKYVEEEISKDKKALIEGGIEGILKKLDDPFTRYMPPATFKSMQEETDGEFGGLGILLGVRDNLLTIISPMEGTPAFRVGVRAGDKIAKINGQSTEGMSVQQAVKILRGKPKTEVTISIIREGEKALIDYTIVRDLIKVPSVKAGRINKDIAYARLTGFVQTSGKDLRKELDQIAEKSDIKGLILDLRGNPGGLLSAAVEVAQVFLERMKTVVSIKEREGEPTIFSSKAYEPINWPLVVLIDGGSASASEIVAGAIKDHNRGILMGTKSFGKGSVQTVLPLQDGSALALTTAYYYTPADIKIHKKGIVPDIEVAFPKLTNEQLKEYRDELERIANQGYEQTRRKQEEYLHEDHSNSPSTTSTSMTTITTNSLESEAPTPTSTSEFIAIPKFDVQLERAVDVLKASSIFMKLHDSPTGNQ